MYNFYLKDERNKIKDIVINFINGSGCDSNTAEVLMNLLKLIDKQDKEFIRLLKEEIDKTLEEGITRNEVLPKDWAMDRINDVIDKLAGNKLVENSKQ